MNRIGLKVLFIILVIAIVIMIPIMIIKRIRRKLAASSGQMRTPPQNGPYISAEYMPDGGIFEDGKCGWLDIECEDGEVQTVALNFNKKAPVPIFIPLKTAKYRITYRSKSKAGMMATGVLKSINENNGASGAFANAVFDAGVGFGQLESVVVDVDATFVMKLSCSTDGLEKHCKVIE